MFHRGPRELWCRKGKIGGEKGKKKPIKPKILTSQPRVQQLCPCYGVRCNALDGGTCQKQDVGKAWWIKPLFLSELHLNALEVLVGQAGME